VLGASENEEEEEAFPLTDLNDYVYVAVEPSGGGGWGAGGVDVITAHVKQASVSGQVMEQNRASE
jgi:hypothetical protein